VPPEEEEEADEDARFVVVTFYKFVPLEDPHAEVVRHLNFLQVRFFFLPARLRLVLPCVFSFSTQFTTCFGLNFFFLLCTLSYQGRDIHGRIYLNEQGINAQVTQQASAPSPE
jgi:hypothetical protein